VPGATVTEPGYPVPPVTNERRTATTRLRLLAASLLAAACGVLHAVWVLFPLLDARFTADLMDIPLDPQFRVGTLTVLVIAAVPVLAVASSLWIFHSRTQAAIMAGVAGVTALGLALPDIGGSTSGWIPGGLLIPIALLTYALRDRRKE